MKAIQNSGPEILFGRINCYTAILNRYRNSTIIDDVAKASVSSGNLPPKNKSPDEYAKELEQWLKKMKCTGVTGIRLENFGDIKVGILDDNVDPNAPILEPYPNLWSQKYKYKGYNDEFGRPRGKASIELENGDNICGT